MAKIAFVFPGTGWSTGWLEWDKMFMKIQQWQKMFLTKHASEAVDLDLKALF